MFSERSWLLHTYCVGCWAGSDGPKASEFKIRISTHFSSRLHHTRCFSSVK